MAVGRWPRAIFYDSKTTLFDWAWSWREAAQRIVAKYGGGVDVDEFTEDWIVMFEGFQRRAAFTRYADLTNHIREGLRYAYRLHGIRGNPDEDVRIFLDLQERVEPFPEVLEELQRQRELGVKILIFSDVETKYIEMYVSKLRGFRPDFVGSTEQARVHKPNPRVYFWVLRQVGLEPRDVLYCAAPQFDVQGAIACGMKAAWLRRAHGRLGRRNVTFEAGDVPADYEIEDLRQLTRIVEMNLRMT
jgi:2-haloalkanoic acid dehalogenase type II